MDIRERVLNAFLQEHREHLEGIRLHLDSWPAVEKAAMEEAFRMAHSLKGGARVCDLETVEKLAHYLEHLFAALLAGREMAAGGEHGQRVVIDRVLDAIEDYMAAVGAKRLPEEPVGLFESLGLAHPGTPDLPTPQAPLQPPSPPQEETRPGGSTPVAASSDLLRINAYHLDRLLVSSSLLLAEAVRQDELEKQLRELGAFVRNLQRTCEEDLRQVFPSGAEMTPLDELRRGLGDALGQIRRIRLSQQRGSHALRVTGEQLEKDVRQARMTPVGSIFEAFPKMVRDLAAEEGKLVEFRATGLDREADRLVLQALKDPVMHALRNAVHHGIELPSERRALSKPERGVIRLEVEVSGSEMRLSIWDDGRGLDTGVIRAQALRREILSEEEAGQLDEEEIYDLLFRPGFSTTREVTRVSGRGMGLSVVKEAINRLQGSVEMFPDPEGGTCLRMITPVSIATHRMLLVRSATSRFAIPAGAIHSLLRLSPGDLRTLDGRSMIVLDGEPILLATLESAFGDGSPQLSTTGGYLQVVILKVGERHLALSVEAMLRELALLIHPLPVPAAASPYFSGAVILEDGSVALVVNASTLVERFKGGQLEEPVETGTAKLVARKPLVLVVDDSFTARTLQKSILEADGYEVQIAVDGVQALAMLQVEEFDAVVTDVQMPNMDGFRLLEELKASPKLENVPVILVTSLSSEEDQARGLSLGADAYIVKQKFDHRDLLEAVRQIVRPSDE